jgi:glycine cleavage system pyridoxal-binding protein P
LKTIGVQSLDELIDKTIPAFHQAEKSVESAHLQ